MIDEVRDIFQPLSMHGNDTQPRLQRILKRWSAAGPEHAAKTIKSQRRTRSSASLEDALL